MDTNILIDEHSMTAMAAKKAVMEVERVMVNKIESDLQVYFDMPYDIEFSSTPFDNYTSRKLSNRGDHPTLGMRSRCAASPAIHN